LWVAAALAAMGYTEQVRRMVLVLDGEEDSINNKSGRIMLAVGFIKSTAFFYSFFWIKRILPLIDKPTIKT
jgi:hypothetical protein